MDLFDLHCDTVMRISDRGETLENAAGHISLPLASGIDRYGQVFACFVHDRYKGEAAWLQYHRQQRYFERQLHRFAHKITLCRTGADVSAAFAAGKRAAVLSIENGSALNGRIDRLERAAAEGVRILTLTWFGENQLGCGSGVGGPLKEFGFEVLDGCKRLGILPDISHLSDEGVKDVFSHWEGPLIASHSNARAVMDVPRNLPDWQIEEICRRKGLIGVTFSRSMLGGEGQPVSMEDICRQIFYLLEKGCGEILAIGSDFDGAHLPGDMAGIADMSRLYKRLRKEGLSDTQLKALFFDNANTFLCKQLGGTKQ